MNISPETFNKWRIVPRILVSLYGYMCYDIASWYMSLQDPSNAQTTFVSVIWGASAAWFGLYVNSGKTSEHPSKGD
jgi:hypothetical protein